MPSNFTYQAGSEERLDTSEFRYRITPFMHGKNIRHLLQDRLTLIPSMAASVYETGLFAVGKSPNSVKAELRNLNYLFTWAVKTGLELDSLLLTGGRLQVRHIRAFKAWLRGRANLRKKEKGKLVPLDTIYQNGIVTSCAAATQWFYDQYGEFTSNTERVEALNQLRKDWKAIKTKKHKKRVASDLTEEEIKAIDQALRPQNRMVHGVSEAIVYRDYLMWRIAIEFGLRIGEILLLRLEDLPSMGRNTIRIVRLEERGNNYYDPRGKHAPRVKTLSRELGFIIANSPIPRHLSIYTTRHRRRLVVKHGRPVWQPIMDHSFVFLNHKDGMPLSMSSAQDLAREIRKLSGVDIFHWHIARHAFFNRAYATITDDPEFKDRKQDLITYGGWVSDQSIEIYIQRARKKRAAIALEFWQDGNVWGSLEE